MIGIDTGGTFTDVVAMDRRSGALHTLKVPSNPEDPSDAVLRGVAAFLDEVPDALPADIAFFAHGTTVATNAVIERKGATTGLLITKGTGAVYLARMSRQPAPSEMLNPAFQKPALLVPARRTREVRARLLHDGSELMPLDSEEVVTQVRQLVDAYGIDALAVCYLYSFMSPVHERETKRLLAGAFPTLRVSLSSDVLPIIREYKRLSATVLDAFVGPTLERYLRRLGAGLREHGVRTRQLFIMQSNGGLMSIDVASGNPVQTLLSGPAAGVISGRYLSEISGLPNVVTFDVGGTSTDIATIVDREITETTEGAVAGHDAPMPMNEIGTIGAGGGTIARIGTDGRLHVGPHSAGARPGPVCYGHGGHEPTVTDADVVLGYLNPDNFLGGRIRLDRDAAARAIEERVARPLGLTLDEAAHGIVKIVNSNMEGELRLRLLSRGLNPRDFALVAIGGAGPVHGSMVAKDVGIDTVLIPPFPGLGSAMGLLLTDIKHTYVQSHPNRLHTFDCKTMNSIFGGLAERARAEAREEGTPIEAVRLDYLLDLRYVGQGYDLPVTCSSGTLADADKPALAERFHALHHRVYGHSAPGAAVDVVSFRVDSTAALPRLRLPLIEKALRGAETPAPARSRSVVFEVGGSGATSRVDTPVYDRTRLRAGQRFAGPAIVEQADTTVVIVPGQSVTVDDFGNLIARFS